MHDTRDDKKPTYPTAAHGPIPAFSSYEEEARWWDAHDTGTREFASALTPVAVRSTRNFTKQLMFRVDEETDRALERIAEASGVKKATLVRKVVKDWLRDRESHAS